MRIDNLKKIKKINDNKFFFYTNYHKLFTNWFMNYRTSNKWEIM